MARLIDTTVLIELERRKLPTPVDLDRIMSGEAVLAAISASEFLTGAYRARTTTMRPEREAYIEDILQRFPVIPFGLQEARVHTRLWADLAARGQMIGSNDLIIAATALAHGHEVIIHNLEDFQRVPGLVALVPSD